MRWLARFLVVLALAAVLVVAVIGLEKYYLPKLLDQARDDSAAPIAASEPAAEEMPPECLSPVDRNSPAAEWARRCVDFWRTVRQLAAEPAARHGAGETKPPRLVPHAEIASARSITEPSAATASEQTLTGQPAAEPSANPIRAASSVQDSGSPALRASLVAAGPIELMQQLRQSDHQASAAAREELIRRGFGEVDLELARQLFDPDPAVRKHLAQAVPRLQSIDAVPWLLWLCRDDDADVRMTAVTLLATTGDPQLLERVETLARQDTDPRIRELAEQIAQQRDIAGTRGGDSDRLGTNAGHGPMRR